MKRARGFTLVELMVVIAIVGVLAVIAQPSFTRMLAKQRTRSAASGLQLSLVKARSEAVKRNASITMAPTGADWNTGWQVKDAAAVVLDNTDPFKGVVISGGGATVSFTGAGRVSGAVPAAFLFTAYGVPSEQRCVSLDPSGRPYVKEGATC
jgi:type IV fimbrial biogenesis protein FimT